MPLLSPDTDADALHARIRAGDLLVACLCAEWCGTCRSYRATFANLAARYPQHCFVWVDVEDHADALGDLDVENFPTLLVQRGRENGRVLFSVRCCRTRVWSRGCCRATWRRPKRCPWRRICVAGYCTRLDAGLLTNTRDVSAALLRLPRNRAYDWRPNSGQPPDLARQQAPTTLEVGEWSHKTLQNLRERSLIIEATPF